MIEQAKGIIAEWTDVTTADAFEVLRHHARNITTNIHELAADFDNGRVRL